MNFASCFALSSLLLLFSPPPQAFALDPVVGYMLGKSALRLLEGGQKTGIIEKPERKSVAGGLSGAFKIGSARMCPGMMMDFVGKTRKSLVVASPDIDNRKLVKKLLEKEKGGVKIELFLKNPERMRRFFKHVRKFSGNDRLFLSDGENALLGLFGGECLVIENAPELVSFWLPENWRP